MKNIVELIACPTDLGQPCIILNSYDKNLESINSANLQLIQKIYILYQICKGMEFLTATAKILHRDLAGRNILITERNNIQDVQVVIADFGKAVYYNPANEYDNTQLALQLLAPEVNMKDHQTTYFLVSDVWSFGCLVWRFLNAGTDLFTAAGITTDKECFTQLCLKFHEHVTQGNGKSFWPVNEKWEQIFQTILRECTMPYSKRKDFTQLKIIMAECLPTNLH